MKTLVTGGAGFIGSHLAERLLSRGAEVEVVDDFNDFYDPDLKRQNLEACRGSGEVVLHEGDIRDAAFVDDVIGKGGFDLVFHLAARAGVRPSIAEPLLYEETNVRGTANLLESCRRHGVDRLIFGSSSSVYGVNSKVPFSEDDPILNPISPYAATKIAGEMLCHVYSHLYGMRITSVRFFTVYGPRQRPDLAIHKFAKLMAAGRAIPVFGDGTAARDYTYVDDIVDGLMAVSDGDWGWEIVNLGDSNPVQLSRLIELLEDSLGIEARRDVQAPQPGDVPITFADIGKARRLLGYEPRVPIEDGIRRFAAWFREHGRPAE
jgi:UDP-glucuronate 4-epimerase